MLRINKVYEKAEHNGFAFVVVQLPGAVVFSRKVWYEKQRKDEWKEEVKRRRKSLMNIILIDENFCDENGINDKTRWVEITFNSSTHSSRLWVHK